MLCDFCGENEASLHFTKIVNGKVEKRDLCEECAYNESYIGNESPFSMHKLFTSIIDGLQGSKSQDHDLICDSCGLSYNAFKKSGKFGCSQCYDTFDEKLDPLFKGIHGDIYHRGKIPINRSEEMKYEKERLALEERLKKAVESENYELAAVLRDKIKDLDKKHSLDGDL